MFKTVQPIKKIVSIDIFNTIIIAKRPLLGEYVRISTKYGLKTTEYQINKRFPVAFKEFKQNFPNYGKGMGIDYNKWWSELIKRVYYPESINQKIADEILEMSESKIGYTTYPDVVDFLMEMNKRDDVVLVTLSNGEPRLIKAMESLDILKYFHKVYLSYDIELMKPDPEAFHYVFEDIKSQFSESMFSLNEAYHIGDEYINDLEGSYNAGWNGILVDRTEGLKKFKKSILKKPQDEKSLLMKIAMTSANTVTNEENELKKIENRKYITNSFVNIPILLDNK